MSKKSIINILMRSYFGMPGLPIVDQTVSFYYPDSEENWHKNKHKTRYTNTDITYKLNSYGLRSDEFNDALNYKKRVMFIGCSHTFGIGLPLESVWAYQFYKLLQKENLADCGFYNLSYGGQSTDYVSRVVCNVISTIQPHAIFCAIPEFSRREFSMNKHVGPYVFRDEKQYQILLDDDHIRYQTQKNLMMIDLACEKYNTKFYFAQSYCNKSANRFQILNINNLQNVFEYDLYFEVRDFARDCMHYGHSTHETYAQKFYDLCKGDLANHFQSYMQANQS